MTNDYILISDYFSEDIQGGGELNDEELFNCLNKENNIIKIKSANVTLDFLQKKNKSNFIISNFALLEEQNKLFLQEECNYIIYEHDHKYLSKRNPAFYPNFLAPKKDIVNKSFYENAINIFCQSSYHKQIINKNLNLENVKNLSGNLWSEDTLDMLKKYSAKDKNNKCSIMQSPIAHKNTKAAVIFCKHKGYDYDLIPTLKYHDFLDRISDNQTLVFFPKTPETLSRIVVESRMMGMKVITNNMVGATHETWFSKKGHELINLMKDKKNEIIDKIEGSFNG